MLGLFSVAALFCFVLSHFAIALRDYHMFQLNSYKPDVHAAWLRRTFWTDWLPRHMFILIAFVVSFSRSAPGVGAAAALFLAQAWWNRPAGAKKPLVLTGRVRRLLATHAVLVFVAAALAWRFGPPWTALPALALLASPLLTLLANLINSPLEKRINRRYIDDAKRILAGNPGLVVIGVTGSFGKTSVKHFLHKLLSAKYNTLMTPGNFNTTLGVVRTVREELRPFHEVFICEMGAKDRGHIREICDLVKPRHGVLTAIGPQHLETFKTLENVVAAKFELVDALPPNGVAFLNHDSEDIRVHPVSGRTVSYRLEPGEADYIARNIRVDGRGAAFDVGLSDGTERRFETRLVGAHNVLNVLAAIAVADRLGVPADDMAVAVRRLESVPHRLQLIRRGGVIIIDDAYNSNVSGAGAALEALAMFDGFKVLITPGMIELGDMQDQLNHDFGHHAAAVCDLVVLVGDRQTASIRAGLEQAGYAADKIRVVDTVEQAFAAMHAANSGGAEKIVLLENDLPDNY